MGMTLEQMAMLEPTEAQVWRRAQLDYEDGVSVGEVCARYGLARATVYQRAQVWRAASGASSHPDDPAPKASELVLVAWRRLAQAVEGGRIHEALCWRALLTTLEQRAAKDAWAERIKGLSVTEATDTLLAECDRTIADEKAMKASPASLDTLPPGPQSAAETTDDEPPLDPEKVRAWRAWAAVSASLGDPGGVEAPAAGPPVPEVAFAGPGP